MGKIKQNIFADMADAMESTEQALFVAKAAVFVAFVVFWIMSDSLIFAVIATVITGGIIGALAMLCVWIIGMIFGRRDLPDNTPAQSIAPAVPTPGPAPGHHKPIRAWDDIPPFAVRQDRLLPQPEYRREISVPPLDISPPVARN